MNYPRNTIDLKMKYTSPLLMAPVGKEMESEVRIEDRSTNKQLLKQYIHTNDAKATPKLKEGERQNEWMPKVYERRLSETMARSQRWMVG